MRWSRCRGQDALRVPFITVIKDLTVCRWHIRNGQGMRGCCPKRAARESRMPTPLRKASTVSTGQRLSTDKAGKRGQMWSLPHWNGWTGTITAGCRAGQVISCRWNQKRGTILHRLTKIWQAQTLPRISGAVQTQITNEIHA